MKTIAQVKRENEEYKALITAVVNGIGKESIEDVNNHGIDGGFGNFIYYRDTIRFARRHLKTIKLLLKNDAENTGMSTLEMVSSFNGLNGDFTQEEVFLVLCGREKDVDSDAWEMINNALAWYAAETVCRWFED